MPRKARDVPWLDQIGRVYYVFWYDKAKRRTERLSLHTEEAGEAARRYAAFLIEGGDIVAGTAKPAGVGLTCAAALDDYQREHAATKSADPARNEPIIRHLKAHFGDVLVKDVDIGMCRTYVAARTAGAIGSVRGGRGKIVRPVSNATARRELVVLSAAAHHAAAWKRITRADVPVLELPDEDATTERWLTREELADLRAAASGELLDMIDVLYYTASRRDAIETLTVFQVKLDQALIHLAKPGEKQTNKRRPIVPIDAAVMPVLKRQVAAALERGTPEIFSLRGMNFYRAFLRAAKAAGVADVSPHVLRHTRATHLLQEGKDIWAVAKLLGDSVQTVEKVYGHHSPRYLAEVLGAPLAKDAKQE